MSIASPTVYGKVIYKHLKPTIIARCGDYDPWNGMYGCGNGAWGHISRSLSLVTLVYGIFPLVEFPQKQTDGNNNDILLVPKRNSGY